MCDPEDLSTEVEEGPDLNREHGAGFDRRDFLRAGLLSAASLTVAGRGGARLLRPTSARAAGTVGPAGLGAVLNAMHIHSSYSEMQGSYDSHLAEAVRCGVQVLWPTDHDWRMNAVNYFTTLRFLKLERSNGSAVTYRAGASGAPLDASATLVASPTSPRDPQGGACHLFARSGGTAPAWADLGVTPSKLLRTGILGTRLSFDVNAVSIGLDAWAEVLISHSYHPARGGRPAGQYQIAYRIGARSGYQTRGLLGIVWLPVMAGSWARLTVDPAGDFARLWPDMANIAGDNNVYALWFRAGSQNGASAEVYFANAFIERTRAQGDAPLFAQRELLDALEPMYGVTIHPGLELSRGSQHTNWFGGSFRMPDYTTVDPADLVAQTRLIHEYGGLASYNHPFGVVQKGLDTPSAQDYRRRRIATFLLQNRCFGADILEVGYHERGRASLETLLALADTLARNGVWLTYNGVSDNHVGTSFSWSRDFAHNTFATGLWAASVVEGDLLDALRAGRSFCGELGVFNGQLWSDVDGAALGSVSISQVNTRRLTISGIGMPANGYIEVVQGPVDYAGSGAPDPGTVVVSKVDVAVLRTTGAATVTLDTSRSSFVRLNLVDASVSRRTCFTSPTWLLREPPPTAIPSMRSA